MLYEYSIGAELGGLRGDAGIPKDRHSRYVWRDLFEQLQPFRGDYEPVVVASTKNLGDRVEIRIRDNGTGIAPEVKDKMFNSFFTTKPTGEGTGLGLSINHDIIVKQHAGSIEVDTLPGQFTEITVILPRAAVFV